MRIMCALAFTLLCAIAVPLGAVTNHTIGATAPAEHTRLLVIPTSWEMHHARFRSGSNSSHSETFREQWYLNASHSGKFFLKSPRAEIRITAEQAQSIYDQDGRLGLTKHDFLELIGFNAGARGLLHGPEALNFLQFELSPGIQLDQDLTIQISDDEHVMISFQVGPVLGLAKSQ